MRRTMKIPASKPRIRVVIALALLARIGCGRRATKKRQKARDPLDLAQRVREVGEW